MWCDNCQTDVATEISDDAQALLCTACGQSVRKIFAPSLHPETKSAREILERWALEQQSLKDATSQGEDTEDTPEAPARPTKPAAPKASIPPKSEIKSFQDLLKAQAPASKEGASPESQSSSSPSPDSFDAVHTDSSDADSPDMEGEAPPPKIKKPKWRVDGEHGAPIGPRAPRQRVIRRPKILDAVESNAPAEPTPPAQTPPPPVAVAPSSHLRVDAGHSGAPQAPHFDLHTLRHPRAKQPGRSEAIWGQLMAYAGVGILTVGTVLVLWGYFGHIEKYASTGWLVSTAGQMLLLLGIVTLVAGGMQQTTHEVSQRIEHLGGRMIRIEQSTDEILKGPHFARARKQGRNASKSAALDEQEAG